MNITQNLNPYYNEFYHRVVLTAVPRTRKEALSETIRDFRVTQMIDEVVLTTSQKPIKRVVRDWTVSYFFANEVDLFRFVAANRQHVTDIDTMPIEVLEVFLKNPNTRVRKTLVWGRFRHILQFDISTEEKLEEFNSTISKYFSDEVYVGSHSGEKNRKIKVYAENDVFEIKIVLGSLMLSHQTIVIESELDFGKQLIDMEKIVLAA